MEYWECDNEEIPALEGRKAEKKLLSMMSELSKRLFMLRLKIGQASEEPLGRVLGYIGMFAGIGVMTFLILWGVESYRE